jgi:hypothetical protein
MNYETFAPRRGWKRLNMHGGNGVQSTRGGAVMGEPPNETRLNKIGKGTQRYRAGLVPITNLMGRRALPSAKILERSGAEEARGHEAMARNLHETFDHRLVQLPLLTPYFHMGQIDLGGDTRVNSFSSGSEK